MSKIMYGSVGALIEQSIRATRRLIHRVRGCRETCHLLTIRLLLGVLQAPNSLPASSCRRLFLVRLRCLAADAA